MKKWLIGSIVGAILVFLWQFLSWTVLNLHADAVKYHPAQDSIMQVLNATNTEEGSYMLPNAKPGTPQKEHMEMAKNMDGKPWASIIYHKQFHYRMFEPIITGFIVCLVLVFLLMYMLTSGGTPTAMRTFTASLAAGIFYFLLGPFTAHNWFDLPINMIKADLVDAIVSWGLCGVWLGWWLNRGR